MRERSPKLLRVESLRVRDVGPIDLHLDSGRVVILSGPSGVGKTVLLRAIADLDPHSGEVWLEERPSLDYPPSEWRRRVGLLPAESQWWEDRIGAHFSQLEPELLSALGLDERIMERGVAQASTGERQRLALARLLVNRPRVLLLDEPTASLDPESVRRVEKILLDYCRRERAGLLWVTHDPAQIERIADRHLIFEANRLKEVHP